MFKGWVVLLILGLGFMYLVNIFLGQAEGENQRYETKTAKSIDQENFDKYHTVDFNGDSILDLSTLSLERGKEIWLESNIKEGIISNFPDFDTMRQMLKNQMVDSDTRNYLLERFTSIEAQYLSGEMNAIEANNLLMYLRHPRP